MKRPSVAQARADRVERLLSEVQHLIARVNGLASALEGLERERARWQSHAEQNLVALRVERERRLVLQRRQTPAIVECPQCKASFPKVGKRKFCSDRCTQRASQKASKSRKFFDKFDKQHGIGKYKATVTNADR